MSASDRVTEIAVFNEKNPQRTSPASPGPALRPGRGRHAHPAGHQPEAGRARAHGRRQRLVRHVDVIVVLAACIEGTPDMARTLIQVPASARKGEAVEVRVTIAHRMETGFRPARTAACCRATS
jgi:hypothetical protein